MNTKFVESRLVIQLKRSGVSFSFMRKTKNQFGEDTTSETVVCVVSGLFHTIQSRVSKSTSDSSQSRSRPQPAIMALSADVASVQMGDKVMVNGREHTVIEVIVLQEWNIISDVILEVADDGN